jgi:DNA-binding MarR family transcriptional regulator
MNRFLIILFAFYRFYNTLCVLFMAIENQPSAAVLETAGLLYRQASRLTRRLRITNPASGPGLSKLGVLARLHQDGPDTASRLAEYLGLQPQSMTRLLSAMENSGLIVRHINKTDRRQNLIELTTVGQRLLRGEIGKRQDRLAHAMISVLTPAEMELLRIAAGLLDRVAVAIETPVASAESEGAPL